MYYIMYILFDTMIIIMNIFYNMIPRDIKFFSVILSGFKNKSVHY